MPKAMLELEMPGSCWECPLSSIGVYWDDNKLYCQIFFDKYFNKESEDKYLCPEEGRRPDCPLKPVEGKEVE